MGEIIQFKLRQRDPHAEVGKLLTDHFEILFGHLAPNKLPLAPLIASDTIKFVKDLPAIPGFSVNLLCPLGSTDGEFAACRAAVQDALKQAADQLDARLRSAETIIMQAVLAAVRRCIE